MRIPDKNWTVWQNSHSTMVCGTMVHMSVTEILYEPDRHVFNFSRKSYSSHQKHSLKVMVITYPLSKWSMVSIV